MLQFRPLSLILAILASLLMLGASAQGRFAAFQASVPSKNNTAGPFRFTLATPSGFISQFSVANPAIRPTTVIAPDYYTRNMAWTCRQEWRLEKAVSIPVRLRLGTLEQVNYLEGKNMPARMQ